VNPVDVMLWSLALILVCVAAFVALCFIYAIIEWAAGVSSIFKERK
jgi:hypothetical protein